MSEFDLVSIDDVDDGVTFLDEWQAAGRRLQEREIAASRSGAPRTRRRRK